MQHLIANNKQAAGHLGLYHKTEVKPGDTYLASINMQSAAKATAECAVTRDLRVHLHLADA